MPIFTFNCKCGNVLEEICKYEDRPDKKKCDCGKWAIRQGIELCTLGKEGYQPQAILENGDHIKGHFGKEAKRRRKP